MRIKYRHNKGSRRAILPGLVVSLVLAGLVGFGFWRSKDHILDLPKTNPEMISQQLETAAAEVTVPRLIVPKIGLSAYIEEVGLTADGNMDTPKVVENTGWYKDGPRPGEAGNAVIDGHLNRSPGVKVGIFWYLRDLVAGDDIYVIDAQHQKHHFKVKEVDRYTLADAPLDKIFGASSRKNLNLITCQGAWDKGNQTYAERLVVYSQLAD